ncbi:MAG: TatD family hydrolase [Treponema sp.]|nr:TatD family hydrolase [Treponema sp.]
MIDMHIHLDLYKNAMQMAELVNKNNKFSLCVTTSPRAWGATRKVFERYKNIKVALGLHPQIIIQKQNELELFIDNIRNSVFIGEIGIDGGKEYLSTKSKQIEIFERIIFECNKIGKRVLSIHSKHAEKEIADILLQNENIGSAIMHWYTGNTKVLNKLVDYGCYFSINPMMMYSAKARKNISFIPLRQILIETDGPFGSYKTTLSMPWNQQEFIGFLANTYKLSFVDMQMQLIKNLNELFFKNDMNFCLE